MKDDNKRERVLLFVAWVLVLLAQIQIHDNTWVFTTLPALAIIAYVLGRLS